MTKNCIKKGALEPFERPFRISNENRSIFVDSAVEEFFVFVIVDIVAPPTKADKNKFSANSTFVAKENAAMASPLTKQSMSESPAPTAAKSSCCKASGIVKDKTFFPNSFFMSKSLCSD